MLFVLLFLFTHSLVCARALLFGHAEEQESNMSAMNTSVQEATKRE